MADFANEVPGGGLEMDYWVLGNDCCTALDITIYTPQAWQIAQERSGPLPAQFSAKTVEIGGWQAQLHTARGGYAPVTAQILVIDFGHTVVRASTNASAPPTPNAPQPNPLIDEVTFLAVMEQLRPYPE